MVASFGGASVRLAAPPLREERDELAVGRPERIRRSLGLGQRDGGERYWQKPRHRVGPAAPTGPAPVRQHVHIMTLQPELNVSTSIHSPTALE